ncbi:hypothetical protein X970_09590 [Pseudomonas monteilii SB3101]|uniref:Uncharacterized protein n=2 Tax=Pseudomonas TaxID=286 RepID=V9V9J2_9PSED|nr:hypothetical protein X969_09930 [Pseudomonas monteilii SB3078]AHC91058.1 hypothetical protein X970_09590 [Pseudomonas monteilii SB3101]ESW41396.1 hypothetical protein O164_00880 [Pseudomonas taiwanensis SJ9]
MTQSPTQNVLDVACRSKTVTINQWIWPFPMFQPRRSRMKMHFVEWAEEESA